MKPSPFPFLYPLESLLTGAAAREQGEFTRVVALVAHTGATRWCGRAWGDVVRAAGDYQVPR